MSCRVVLCVISLTTLVLTTPSTAQLNEPAHADFTFAASYAPRSLDPAVATGAVESQMIRALHEGLLQYAPKKDEPSILQLKPATAESYTCSEDGKTYTFRVRSAARWSDGSPVTAVDFVWSWRRVLHPEVRCVWAFALWDVEGARDYNEAKVVVGDLVEVELAGRRKDEQPFPRGPVVRGKLGGLMKSKRPDIPIGATAVEARLLEHRWRDRWIYTVEVSRKEGATPPVLRHFSRSPLGRKIRGKAVERCHWVLPDFARTVGIRAEDDATLVVTLARPTATFPHQTAQPALSPVQRKCIERYGAPDWTEPENHVGNGAFLLTEHVAKSRIRLTKNPRYHAAASVRLRTIDVLLTPADKDALDLYRRGKVDWVVAVSSKRAKALGKRDDFHSHPTFSTYFFRLNVTRKPLDNPLVRRALNMAIDRRAICEEMGRTAARSLVPPLLDGYIPAQCEASDVAAAQRLLAKAGYPDGKGLPEWTLTFNTSDDHRQIAQMLQAQWAKRLGVRVRLRNQEWYTFLDATYRRDYDIMRGGWIGDFVDPTTFLDLFVTGESQNSTGWSNREYDTLLRRARSERDQKTRMALYKKAEAILMRELPIIPIYFYSSVQLIRPYVGGLHPNVANIHPLHLIRVDRDKKKQVLGARK
jgi:oligopeptide transport system substrate-binding protein